MFYSEYRAKFEHSYLELGSKGERVLGFCHSFLDAKEFPIGYKFDDEDGKLILLLYVP